MTSEDGYYTDSGGWDTRNWMFRALTSPEVEVFKQWARDHSPTDPETHDHSLIHPVIRDEWARLSEEGVMSDEKGYNGWTNYETWSMALWIDNDEGSYRYSRDVARLSLARVKAGHERSADGLLADDLRRWQEDLMPELEASVWSDLLDLAFSEVDWYEIAENYLAEISEKVAE